MIAGLLIFAARISFVIVAIDQQYIRHADRFRKFDGEQFGIPWPCAEAKREPQARFETAEELLLALERGAARPLPPPTATPLVDRGGDAKLHALLMVSLLANVILLYLFLVLSAK